MEQGVGQKDAAVLSPNCVPRGTAALTYQKDKCPQRERGEVQHERRNSRYPHPLRALGRFWKQLRQDKGNSSKHSP
jgi:hypothetical protein